MDLNHDKVIQSERKFFGNATEFVFGLLLNLFPFRKHIRTTNELETDGTCVCTRYLFASQCQYNSITGAPLRYCSPPVLRFTSLASAISPRRLSLIHPL
jgi:hypothetical protein